MSWIRNTVLKLCSRITVIVPYAVTVWGCRTCFSCMCVETCNQCCGAGPDPGSGMETVRIRDPALTSRIRNTSCNTICYSCMMIVMGNTRDGTGIRDPGWVKIRIRDKHPGSATLYSCYDVDLLLFLCSVLRIWIRDTVPFWSLDPEYVRSVSGSGIPN
jgi:hypothetical protein